MTENSAHTPRGPIEHGQLPTRVAVLVPVFRQYGEGTRGDGSSDVPRRSEEARLAEACGLARAIGLEIEISEIVSGQKPRPATLIGTGKVEALKDVLAEKEVGLAIFDHPLTPVQQRNLERELDVKVLDRTGLILEIFGERAQTKEGRLQVELAHLNYQRGRLVRSWTHLERQRGGAGFLGGPGETQIEADRRQLQDRIKRLEKDLEQVRRTRTLHRAQRKKVPHPVVALVGYTNAGKSTLFNRLTGASVMAEDLLFATLDPTMRRTSLPNGTEVLLSDTVGFVSNLPTHLVAAFRATLEEVIEADLILHVRDISDPDTSAQAEDVLRVLRDLEIDADDETKVLEVWNKIDRVEEPELDHLKASLARSSEEGMPQLVSAWEGAGVAELQNEIERRIAGRAASMDVRLAAEDLSLLSWLYENGTVTDRRDEEDGSVMLTADLTAKARSEFLRLTGRGPKPVDDF